LWEQAGLIAGTLAERYFIENCGIKGAALSPTHAPKKRRNPANPR
jgi:hypothetical protein